MYNPLLPIPSPPRSMKKAIYSWSFDPFTKWHKDILKRAWDKFDQVIVWVGQNPDKKYMFSFPERVEMIKQATQRGIESVANIEVLPFSGLLVDFAFEHGVTTIARGIRGGNDLENESLLHWVGESQKLGIDTVFLMARQDQTHISSSTTKAILKEQWLIQDYVTLNVKHFLEARMMGQYLVGVTGTIGAGKSYITQKFVELWEANQIPVHNIDLDKIGHWILQTAPSQGYQQIRQQLIAYFGQEIQGSDGFIDRKILWEIVFNHPEKRKILDEILYNPILLKIRKEMTGKKWIILLNGALLAESGITNLSNNNIVLVWVNHETQQHRLSERDLSGEQIETRIKSQYSNELKKSKISEHIQDSWYGYLNEFENSGANAPEISQLFDKVLSSVDIFWELRIQSVFHSLGKEALWQDLYAKLKLCYDDPKRLYHNWFHIVACLNHLYEIKSILHQDDFHQLFLAILFHDSIYDISAKKWENEEKSALLSAQRLEDLQLSPALISRVQELIMLTASHTIQTNDDIGKYMIDIDLAILGQSWEFYQEYQKSIRHEYASVWEALYTEGRIKFLQSMLTRRLFQTDYFYEKYELQAKENIQKELFLFTK